MFAQDKQVVRQDYPEAFSVIGNLLDREDWDDSDVRECFDEVCEAIRNVARERILQTKVAPLTERGRGRPTRGVATTDWAGSSTLSWEPPG